MPIAANDINVLSIETSDLDYSAGSNIDVIVEAEVGNGLHASSSKYYLRMTMTDRTNPALLNSQEVVGSYGDVNWPAPGVHSFTFIVPGTATVGREGNILEPQARLISNSSAPFDSSHVVGGSVLITP